MSKRMKWTRLREATAVASKPALIRGQTDDTDNDQPCPNCSGSGINEGALCSECDGSGSMMREAASSSEEVVCPTCDGKGTIMGGHRECPDCNGTGKVTSAQADKLKESTKFILDFVDLGGQNVVMAEHWIEGSLRESAIKRLSEKDYSTDTRIEFAKQGKAIPIRNDKGDIIGGAFPINDAGDVEDAVKAFGRNPTPQTKNHIIKNARRLGATNELPKDWSGSTAKESASLADRIDALEKSLASGSGLIKSIREAKPASMTAAFSTPTRVKTSKGQEGYSVILIREGSGNSEDDQWYTKGAIKELCESGVCEGMQAFGDHPTEEEEETRPERSVKELVGTYHDVKFAESKSKAQAEAIFVPLTLDERHPRYGWVVTLAEAAAKNTAPQPICGISLFGLSAGNDGKRPDGTFGRIVEMIRPSSGDIVTNAGAGGGFIRQLMESARALRNRSRKELNPMQALEYQTKVREAAKRVREATSDEDRNKALGDLAALEAEKIDNVPDTIERLREAAPTLLAKVRETITAEVKEADGDLKKENETLRTRLREAESTIGGITEAISITEALREAGVDKPVELKHYAGMAQQRKLTEAKDIIDMVKTDQEFEKARTDALLAKMSEAFDLDSEIEGAGGRIPAIVKPTDGGVAALREAGIPMLEATE